MHPAVLKPGLMSLLTDIGAEFIFLFLVPRQDLWVKRMCLRQIFEEQIRFPFWYTA